MSKCSTKRCRGIPVLTLKGSPLCEKCWEKHCDINERYAEGIKKALEKFKPEIIGGCFQATRYLIGLYPELKEEIVQVKNKAGDIKHCVAVTPDGLIIDTQHFQFSAVQSLDEAFKNTTIFTREQHEAYLTRYIIGAEE